MRYLAPATDVHDELDLVTIPSVGKAAPAPRKSAASETRSLGEGGTIACPRRRAGTRRRATTRYLSIPSLCARASAGCAGPSGRRELLLRQLRGGTGNHADYD
jgi:hypothetical protein